VWLDEPESTPKRSWRGTVGSSPQSTESRTTVAVTELVEEAREPEEA
jgi:hypothetical protein